jgi:hypothetical protein
MHRVLVRCWNGMNVCIQGQGKWWDAGYTAACVKLWGQVYEQNGSAGSMQVVLSDEEGGAVRCARV